MNIYELLDYIVCVIWAYYKVPIIAIYCIERLVYTSFLYMDSYDKWWLGLIPCGQFLVKRELSSLNLVVMIIGVLCGGITLITTGMLIFMIPWLIIVVYSDIRFCFMFMNDTNKYIYGLVPFAKYYYMIKEVVILCRS